MPRVQPSKDRKKQKTTTTKKNPKLQKQSYYYTLLEWLKSQTLKIPNIRENVWSDRNSHSPLVRMQNDVAILAGFCKIKHSLPCELKTYVHMKPGQECF